MSPQDQGKILQQAAELESMAASLERECATWKNEASLEEPKFPSQAYEAMRDEEKRRSNVVWENAVATGRLCCTLHDIGAFDSQARLRNAVCHVRAEMEKARRENKPPIYYFIVNLPYRPKDISESYDVYYVKLFEGFCKILADTPEDWREFQRYYVNPEEKARFHARMMRQLGKSLKSAS
jgi:hypothetical protein